MSDLAVPLSPLRAAPWTAYTTLVRWQMAQIGTSLLPLVIVVQALMAAGLIVGFGFLIPDIDAATALQLSTGAPTILLLTVGLVIVPQSVAYARASGTFAYQRSLPVARPLVLLADLTVWSVVALPSVAVAMLVAQLHYDLSLTFDWPLLVGTAVLVTLTATAVGYMIAVVLPSLVAQLVSQVLVFFVLLFSPISFPASRPASTRRRRATSPSSWRGAWSAWPSASAPSSSATDHPTGPSTWSR